MASNERKKRNSHRMMFVLLLWGATALKPASAQADIFDDLANAIMTVTGLKGAVKALAGGAAAGLRSELDGYIQHEVDPLLDKADAILKSRIDQAASNAVAVLRQAETSLRHLLQEAHDLTADLIRQASTATHQALVQLDSIIQGALCTLADDHGIIIALPLLGSSNELQVRNPKLTQCYRDYPPAQHNPYKATFSGWMYYAGETCEAELSLNEIDPHDPRSVIQVANAFADIAAHARQAYCRMPTSASKNTMLSTWKHAEEEADFFFGLADASGANR